MCHIVYETNHIHKKPIQHIELLLIDTKYNSQMTEKRRNLQQQERQMENRKYKKIDFFFQRKISLSLLNHLRTSMLEKYACILLQMNTFLT